MATAVGAGLSFGVCGPLVFANEGTTLDAHRFACENGGQGLSVVDVLQATGDHSIFPDLFQQYDPEGFISGIVSGLVDGAPVLIRAEKRLCEDWVRFWLRNRTPNTAESIGEQVLVWTAGGTMRPAPSGRDDDPGTDLQELCADRMALGTGELTAPEGTLVRSATRYSCCSLIRFSLRAASAGELLVQSLCSTTLPEQRGHHEARVFLAGAVLRLANGALQPLIPRKTKEIVHVVLFAPLHQPLACEAAVTTDDALQFAVGIQIYDDLPGLPASIVVVEEVLDEESLNFLRSMKDPMVATHPVANRWGAFRTLERRLPGEGPSDVTLSPINETCSEPVENAATEIHVAQQKLAGIGGDRSAVERTHYLLASKPLKMKLTFRTLLSKHWAGPAWVCCLW